MTTKRYARHLLLRLLKVLAIWYAIYFIGIYIVATDVAAYINSLMPGGSYIGGH